MTGISMNRRFSAAGLMRVAADRGVAYIGNGKVKVQDVQYPAGGEKFVVDPHGLGAKPA